MSRYALRGPYSVSSCGKHFLHQSSRRELGRALSTVCSRNFHLFFECFGFSAVSDVTAAKWVQGPPEMRLVPHRVRRPAIASVGPFMCTNTLFLSSDGSWSCITLLRLWSPLQIVSELSSQGKELAQPLVFRAWPWPCEPCSSMTASKSKISLS